MIVKVQLNDKEQSLTFEEIYFILDHAAFDDMSDKAKAEILYVAGHSAGFKGCWEEYYERSDTLLKSLLLAMKDARACFSDDGQMVTKERLEAWDDAIHDAAKWIGYGEEGGGE